MQPLQDGSAENLSISWDVPSFKQNYGRNVPETDPAGGVTMLDALDCGDRAASGSGSWPAGTEAEDRSPSCMQLPESRKVSACGAGDADVATPAPAVRLRLDSGSSNGACTLLTPNTSPGAALCHPAADPMPAVPYMACMARCTLPAPDCPASRHSGGNAKQYFRQYRAAHISAPAACRKVDGVVDAGLACRAHAGRRARVAAGPR